MTAEEDGPTMSRADRFWEIAMRGALRPLNAIEQAALLPLIVQYHAAGPKDRDTAAIPMLRDDGAAVAVKLTIERVESYAAAYAAHEPWTAQQFSFPADA